jgi:hypothetical protein
VGALVSGNIRVRAASSPAGSSRPGSPLSAGRLFSLALCALLVATYPASKRRPCAARGFRRRAGRRVVVGVAALAAFVLAGDGAPRAGAGGRRVSWPFHR